MCYNKTYICIQYLTKLNIMKKTLKNSLAGFLICIAVLLLFSEYDFNNTTALLYFIFIKILGFGFGYVGFKILDY